MNDRINVDTLAVAKMLEEIGYERSAAERVTTRVAQFVQAEHARGVSRDEISYGLARVPQTYGQAR